MATTLSSITIMELLLLTWLHNVYMRPEVITVRLATSKYLNALIDDGLIVYTDNLYPRCCITSKGKKILAKNIHLLTPEEEEKSYCFPTDVLIGLE